MEEEVLNCRFYFIVLHSSQKHMYMDYCHGFECNLELIARVNGYYLKEAKLGAIMPFRSGVLLIPNCTRKHAIDC